jgi:hypothetical protein
VEWGTMPFVTIIEENMKCHPFVAIIKANMECVLRSLRDDPFPSTK